MASNLAPLPGRFDRHITVSLPDRAGRQAILQIHTAKTPLHEEVSLERLARLTTGMCGADLANLVNEAALCAARRDLETIDHDCFEDALARVQLGALRPLVMTEEERRIIAYHEGGHLVCACLLGLPTTSATVVPKGQNLGLVRFKDSTSTFQTDPAKARQLIVCTLAARAAEVGEVARREARRRVSRPGREPGPIRRARCAGLRPQARHQVDHLRAIRGAQPGQIDFFRLAHRLLPVVHAAADLTFSAHTKSTLARRSLLESLSPPPPPTPIGRGAVTVSNLAFEM